MGPEPLTSPPAPEKSLAAPADEWVLAIGLGQWPVLGGVLRALTPFGPVLLWGSGPVPEAAFLAACPHRRAPLTPACVTGTRLTCPRHGAEFDLPSGESAGLGRLSRPAEPLRRLDLRCNGAVVEIRCPRPVRLPAGPGT